MYAVMHELTDQVIIDELVVGFHDVFLNNAKNNLSSLLFV